MNDLITKIYNGIPTIDSRDVAEITEIRHSDLLDKINSYIHILENGKFRSLNFFVPSTYFVAGQSREYPCYLLTRKGCDMVANKMTGEKGVLFTAAYVTKFEEMENHLTRQLPQNYKQALLALVAAEEEKELLHSENSRQKQIIGELKPKADYTDSILKNKGLVTITQIAKDYGMSGQEMNDILHTHNVQYKQSGQWLLYTKYQDKGYTHSDTIDILRSDGRPDVKMNTKWTQKGRLFIYGLLKKSDILPVIEQKCLA